MSRTHFKIGKTWLPEEAMAACGFDFPVAEVDNLPDGVTCRRCKATLAWKEARDSGQATGKLTGPAVSLQNPKAGRTKAERQRRADLIEQALGA